MTSTPKYILVSLPTSISPSNDHEEALSALKATITKDNGTVYRFPIPELKIGTLDALVQQADELAKLDGACEGVVSRIGDGLRSILQGDQEKIAQQKAVETSEPLPPTPLGERPFNVRCAIFIFGLYGGLLEPVDQYLRTFSWNKVKYRADRSLPELADVLHKV